jgi:magnesium chelatase family protein
VPRLNYEQLTKKAAPETSAVVKERVDKARAIQRQRYKKDGFSFNAFLESKEIEKYCQVSGDGNDLLKMAILELGLSARAYDKVLKVARTIADLEEKETIEASHISEAISYRSLDRNLWV